MWHPRKIIAVISITLGTVALGLAAGPAAADPNETQLGNEERSKLDAFEGVSIDKADKVFAAKDWPRAVAEYDAFIVQFTDSKITPYAILRKGRSMQMLDKRFEAIKVYQEVLDFFPDDVKYATAALFRIGECHSQNGDVEKAMKAWSQLADDADYVKHVLAETKLLLGQGDAERWYALRNDAGAIERLEQRVEIRFPHTRKLAYAADEPVSIDVDCKNVPTLLVKVFAIDAARKLRQR